MRADCVGCFGNKDIATPHLDALASEGVKFTRAYAANPTCTPSRASIVTGRYPHCHGVLCNGIPLPETEQTIPEVLSNNGYRTGAVGKVHLRPHDRDFNRERCVEYEGEPPYYGFQSIHLSDDYKLGDYLDYIASEHPEYLAAARDEDDQGESKSGSIGDWKPGLPPELHQTSWVVDRAIEFIEEQNDAPFFLWCGFTDPHHPFNPPDPYYSMYPPSVRLPWQRNVDLTAFPPHWQQRQRGHNNWPDDRFDHLLRLYYGMITLIDDNVGRLRKRVDELGLSQNTVILFLSDHGELMGDHGLMLKGPYHLEALVRTPMIWCGPGITPGATNERVTRTIDVASTLFEMAGLSPVQGVQGSSLVPELAGAAPAADRCALVEFRPWAPYDGWPKENPEDAPGPGPEVRTLITERWKLTCYAGLPYGELFDLQEDPCERLNLWSSDSHASVRTDLMEQLLMEIVQTTDPLPVRVAPY